RHFLTAAHAQRRDAADVHLVYRGRGAAEDDLVELARGEGLAYEQRAPGLRRQIAGGEWPGAVARLEKRRACAVDDVNRLHAAFTMGRAVSLSASAAPGSSAMAAHSRLRESSGGRHGVPSGKMVQRSMVAIHFIGKFDSTWSIACCA